MENAIRTENYMYCICFMTKMHQEEDAKRVLKNDLQEAIIDLQSIIGREEKMKKAILIKSISPISDMRL